MRDILFRKWTVIGFLVLLACILVVLVEFIFQRHQEVMRQEIQSRTTEELSIIRFKLEATVLADIYVAKSLSTLTTVNASTVAESWEKVSQRIMDQGKYIRSLALAPNDIIEYVYPLEGNRKALGLDFRTIPEQWATVQRAHELKEIFIAGPVDLVQGGSAIVARCPVFLDPPYNQFYWGVISVVIDIDSLFKSLAVDDVLRGYNIAIRGKDSAGEQGDVFWGQPDVFEHAFAKETIYFPYGSWSIAIAERDNINILDQVPWFQAHIVRVIGYLLLVFLIASFWVIYRLYDKSNRLSLYDELTHLPNRRYFMNELNRYFEREKKARQPTGFALLCIDVNKFKTINDNYGHIVGDQVLVECARRIENAIRDNDCAARIGGDEFLVLLKGGEKEEDLRKIMERVRHAVRVTPVICEELAIPVGISIGYTCYRPEMKSVNEMINHADNEMYDEKYAS
ncbi:diguanylate cyclase [Vibrio mangrovi]|uniref:Diguanylate cyclase n=1 Tax=Vibrio mangrovi TaxID=474394 RepID=A0A1Y6IZ84_9VIBR|nr:diguanylate cyclase [Vibrio mangrovi]MDW6005111.1 diguanylate cyclase [Vibrio mangrovi]SMS02967.1 putative diguanylate cyclase YcdT [Vibrio mangrovi]